MQGTFTIQGRLVGMNEIIGAARNNRFGSASQKKSQMQIVTDAIIADEVFRNLRFEKKVVVYIKFFEASRKRDCDNIISGGCKSLMDSLVLNRILIDDSQKYVTKITCEILTDKENPRIEVFLKEL